jgi:hypothetical protein
MSADHNRLDALRRLAKDRAATPAEKATARRLAKALAAKIGKRPRRSRRRGHGPALPEPPAARWRRRWVVWLEVALHKIAVAGRWLYGIWIVSAIGMVLIAMLGSDPQLELFCGLERQLAGTPDHLIHPARPFRFVFKPPWVVEGGWWADGDAGSYGVLQGLIELGDSRAVPLGPSKTARYPESPGRTWKLTSR